MAERQTWITGIGIVSCLGEGLDAHWQGLNAAPPAADATSFAPYIVHRIVPLEMDKQIPKKGDQRQMEPWQRIGTYAAGLALDSAGVKARQEFLSRMDMIVAAGGGERDAQVDLNVAANVDKAAKAEAFVNERLMSDLRPTLFLAQLSNLLAGNISIVHGVTGSSRTFMGEESAGVEAVRVAHARIQAGQSDLALVGGAYNAERWEVMLHFALGRRLARGEAKPVWERDGMELGTIGAFLVLEEKAHAQARGATPLARLAAVASDHVKRAPGAVTAALERMWSAVAPQFDAAQAAVISGASGVAPATEEERAFLGRQNLAVRATGTHLGHGLEPQFPANIALAAAALRAGRLYPGGAADKAMESGLKQVAVTSVGHWRGEGLALVEAID
ncbi:MAG TPA: beta-ketoacyl-ACP synthase [Xanthobacteraceae bacterium]|nr:beta-ketoacyl-ACP synthase [Xanthobacteraceae bacterium]